MRLNANMTMAEREEELAKAIVVCDRMIKDAYMKRAMKQETLDKNGHCDFDLCKVLEETNGLTKEDLKALLKNDDT